MGFFSRFFKIREQDPDSAETTWAMEDNGSELVLFDVNRHTSLLSVLRPGSAADGGQDALKATGGAGLFYCFAAD